jgi:hypothetical protein
LRRWSSISAWAAESVPFRSNASVTIGSSQAS